MALSGIRAWGKSVWWRVERASGPDFFVFVELLPLGESPGPCSSML